MPLLPSSLSGKAVVSNGLKSKERLGINLCDIDRMLPVVRQVILGDKLDLRKESLAWVDKSRMDETCVPFRCDLLTAATICDVIRSHDRMAGDYPTRVYIFRQAWTKLAGNAILALVKPDGSARLNPAVFPAEVVMVKPKPPMRRA